MHVVIAGEGAGMCAQYLRALGLEPTSCRDAAEVADAHGRIPADLVLVPMQRDPGSELLLRILGSAGSPVRGRIVAVLPEDGSVDPREALVWGADDLMGSPLRLEDLQRRCAVLASRRGATDRHAREVLQLSDIVRTQQEALRSPHGVAALKRLLVVRCRALVGAQEALLVHPEGDGLIRYEVVEGRNAALTGETYPRKRSVADLVMRTGEALRSDDVTSEPRFDPTRYAQSGVRSVLAVPIRTVGDWVAVLAVTSDRVGAFDDGDERALRLLCGTLEAAIEAATEEERKQALYRELLETSEALANSEEQLRAFLENLPAPAYIRSVDGTFLHANKAYADLLGVQRTDLLANTYADVLSPELLRRFPEISRELLEKGFLPPQIEQIEIADGRCVPMLVCRFLLRGPKGELLVAGIGIDQTEREAAVDRLRRSEASFRALIENAPEAIIVYANRGVVLCNQAAARMIGAEHPSDVLGFDMLETIHPDDVEEIRAALQRSESTPLTRSYRFYRRDGALRFAESVGIPIDFDGQPSSLIFSRDVTQQLEFQKRMLLTDRLVSVGTLAAGVAHEINNPLAWVMSGLSYALEELKPLADRLPQPQADEIVTALEDVREGADRVRTIVRDLKTFSRADEARHGAVDLTRVLETSIKMAWNEIRHRAQLVRELEPVPSVKGSEVRFGQVFVNLLVNAAQAIPEGKVDAHSITVRMRGGEGHVVVEITDTGAGIPEELRSRIFDPFFTTKPVGEGTGLGLSICHGIIAEAGGSIELESTPGRGSTFRIRLPVAEAEVDEPLSTPATQGQTRRGRVLVVDDEPLICSTIRRTLGAEHDVVTFSRAEEALVHLERDDRFDVVMTDLMMPEIDGIRFYEEASCRWPALAGRFVFLTGGAFTPRSRTFLAAMPNPKLEKPFDTQTLRAFVRGLVR